MPGWIPADGPSREQVQDIHAEAKHAGIRLVVVDDAVARRLGAASHMDPFSRVFHSTPENSYLIGPGDVIQVSVWETPPAVLFGAVELEPSGPVTTHVVDFPAQMVTQSGTITIPFAGYVPVRQKTTQQIEAEIAKRLRGKAHEPQVLVRVVTNNTSNVTVVGDVKQSTLMPLTPKGERLLDALAMGGGVTQPVDRMAIQLSRGDRTAIMPLDSVIRDPKQNVSLRPGDVITALFQPRSFSVLGATGKNEEIPFEARGISLAQALARSGGLDDRRADARGVFIFRFENPDPGPSEAMAQSFPADPVPVVYTLDLRNPASFFAAQHFPIRDHDVIYVANAPAAEFDKFLRMVLSIAMPSITLDRALR